MSFFHNYRKTTGLILTILLLAIICSKAIAQNESLEKDSHVKNLTREKLINDYMETVKDKKIQHIFPVSPKKQPQTPRYFSDWTVPKGILYAGTTIFAIILIILIIQNLKNSYPKTVESEAIIPSFTTKNFTKIAHSADELAKSGNYTLAIHAILINTLTELKRILALSLPISLTSREITAKLTLKPSQKEALVSLVNQVEISYFGNHKPGEKDYLLCRQSFNSLIHSLKSEPL